MKAKKYNFDEVISRRGTSSVKHDLLKSRFGTDDLLPMWVADMDFKSPDFVIDAIKQRCNHEFLGYTFASNSYYEAIIDWMLRHYSIAAEKGELHYIPGIVVGIAYCIQAFTNVGDKILINTPVYPPFIELPTKNGRELVVSKLNLIDGRFAIDFDDFANKAKSCKLMIMSNPHNPGGTVWSQEDLSKIADICYENKVIVISDEIHADLTLPGFKHTSFSTVSERAKKISITFIAPSKTFNIAGLSSSVSYVPDDGLREKYYNYLEDSELANGNVFAYTGAEAAFRNGEEWLSQLLQYLSNNIKFANEYIRTNMPKVSLIVPEASYLLWLDFNGYKLSHQELEEILIKKAKVALNSGLTFGGVDYAGFFRMNIGCPREVVEEGLRRIKDAFDECEK